MVTWSAFCRYMSEAKPRAPRAAYAAVRADGAARVTARLQSGHADAPLDFTDLVSRLEDATR